MTDVGGEQYNCHDPQLQKLAIDARRRVARFCATDPADTAGRADLLAAIFGRVERGVHIEPPFYAEYGVHTSIGEDTFWLGAGVIVLTGVIVGEPGASGEDGGEAQQSRSLPSDVVAELHVQARDVRVEVT